MKEIKIGLIGCGLLGNIHMMALNTIIEEEYFTKQAKIEITALCDINTEHLIKYNESLQIPHTFTDYHDLIACPDVNCVFIVTPTSFHKEIFLAAAKAKKAIFIEKPVTDPPSEIDTMIKARDAADITVQVGLVLRNSPIMWYVHQLINKAENKLSWGRLQNVIFRDSQDKPYTGSGSHPSTWRRDPAQAFHGCLFEHSIHDVDILRYWCGDITEIYAKVKFFAGIAPIEDSVCATFELVNGASAHLTSMWHNIPFDQRDFELFFENTYLNFVLDMLNGTVTIIEKEKKKIVIKSADVDIEYRKAFGIADHPQFWLEGYGYEDIAFLRSLIEEKPASPSLEDAKIAHEIVDACYRSSKSNHVIKL